MTACKTTKLVPEGKYLLVKNKIKSQDEANNRFAELASKLDENQAIYIKHKPNRKIIGVFKYHLGMYVAGTSTKYPWKNDSIKWRRYLRRIGEPPVILDTLEVIKSEENLKRYLFSEGFYNSEISHQINYLKKKKAVVTYYINPKVAFTINKVTLAADDAEIDKILNDTMTNTFLVPGKILDLDIIAKERNRLTAVLKNNGYADFTKDYFDFEIDTFRARNAVNVNISVANKSDNERFIQKKISEINIIFHNDAETQDTSEGLIVYKNCNYYFNGYPLNPYIIDKNITIRKGDRYNQSEIDLTNIKLSELSILKFIDISFTPSPTDSVTSLVMNINLKTGLRQALVFEPQTFVSQMNRVQNISNTNSFGLAASIALSNKNIFHNAEQLDIAFTTRFETQLIFDDKKKLEYSTQQSVNTTLTIPRSALLKPLDKWHNVKGIKTVYKLSFLYEFNPDYTRRILPFTYQYQIRSNKFNWFYNFFELAFSKNFLSPSIQLEGKEDSAYIARLFSNNLITNTSLSFTYNNMSTAKGRSFYMLRVNALELGGNIHRLIRRAMDTEKKQDTTYQIWGVDYYQYIKSEIDVRCSTKLTPFNSTCVRVNIGAGYPYGNTKVLPFDKSFYIGGTTSLRGWRPRSIGPGTYNDSNSTYNVDRNGDMIIQGSAEYRFSLIDNVLEGALFGDAGNIWQIRPAGTPDPSKMFKLNTLFKSMAFNTGVGLRIDFQFFLFRFDWGWQMHNPELAEGTRWVAKGFAKNNYFTKYSILNFGIGYPF